MSGTLKRFCRVSNEPDTITIYWGIYLCLFIQTYLYCVGEYLYGDMHPVWASQVALVIKNSPANAGDAGPSLGCECALEEGMATHSSILAWRISWIEEPGRSQRVRHNLACMHI